jgi:NAD(P)-dependent dehydrogenase (short-subunit alcohol dehydrogenase family)
MTTHQASSFPQRALITGGAGFIGSHLAERLLKEGAAVTVVDDLSTGSLDNLSLAIRHPRFRFIQARVSTCSELRTRFPGGSSLPSRRRRGHGPGVREPVRC